MGEGEGACSLPQWFIDSQSVGLLVAVVLEAACLLVKPEPVLFVGTLEDWVWGEVRGAISGEGLAVSGVRREVGVETHRFSSAVIAGSQSD